MPLDDFADREIAARTRKGEALSKEMPTGLATFADFFEAFMDRYGIDSDFITVSQAWKAYRERQGFDS